MWDISVRRLDAIALAITFVVAIVTLWVASDPIPTSNGWPLATLGWSLAASIWSIALLSGVDTTPARVFSLILLVGSVAAFPVLLVVVLFVGPAAVVPVLVVGVIVLAGALGGSTRRQVVWLAAPAVVLLVLGVAYMRWPTTLRMTYAEPALDAYAEQLIRGEGPSLPAYFDTPVTVGSIEVYEVYSDRGSIHLVTGYTGFFGDDEAGVAYFPDEAPDESAGYEHLVGAWYRWPEGGLAGGNLD